MRSPSCHRAYHFVLLFVDPISYVFLCFFYYIFLIGKHFSVYWLLSNSAFFQGEPQVLFFPQPLQIPGIKYIILMYLRKKL